MSESKSKGVVGHRQQREWHDTSAVSKEAILEPDPDRFGSDAASPRLLRPRHGRSRRLPTDRWDSPPPPPESEDESSDSDSFEEDNKVHCCWEPPTLFCLLV